MKTRQSTLFIALILLFSASLNAHAETKVAVYDVRAIYRAETIYKQLYMLHVKKEIKDAIVDIDAKTDALLMKIIASDDPSEIRALQNQMSTLKSKKSSILRAINNSNNRGSESDITEYIKAHYEDKYDVILEKKALINTSYGVHLNVTPVDITSRVIEDITNKINGL